MAESVNYCTVTDILSLGKSLTAQQQEAAEALIQQASAKLRLISKRRGRNLDDEIAADPDFGIAVKSVVVQAVCRAIDTVSESTRAVSQESESIGPYSMSLSYINGGQALYFLRNELKEIGISHQTYGAIDIYRPFKGCDSDVDT